MVVPTQMLLNSNSDFHPRVFVSYAHESELHKQKVAELCHCLQDHGIDAWIDQFENPHPSVWPHWMNQQIRRANFVLVVSSEKYSQYFNGDKDAGSGYGVAWESVLIQAELYENIHGNCKYIPVYFNEGDRKWIPKPLSAGTGYLLDRFEISTNCGYHQLYRRLTDSPEVVPRPLGNLVSLPPVERKAIFNDEKQIVLTENVIAFSERLRNMSQWLTEKNHSLPSGEFISRKEVEGILERLRNGIRSESYLIGQPGAGKTAVLSEVMVRWSAEGGTALAIRADQLPASINSLRDLSHWILQRDGDLIVELKNQTTTSNVIVIIDQLDALANLADLESGRLNAVYDFVSALRADGRLSLVASTRIQEMQVDQRLGAMLANDEKRDFHRIELTTFDIEDTVKPELTAAGIDSSAMSEMELKLLQVPYNLAVFLQYAKESFGQSNLRVLSLRGLHEKRWEILGADPSTALLLDVLRGLARAIREKEVFWHSISDLAVEQSAVDALVENAWIEVRDQKIAFAHQTQYEFAMARELATSVRKFVRYVRKHESGLNVRPAVWHTLKYLRDASEKDYLLAMSELLASVKRRHVRRLLIEFVCIVTDPKPRELQWILAWLKSEDNHSFVCSRVRGNEGWFAAFADEQLLSWMQQTNGKAWPILMVIADATKFAIDRVLQLVERAWVYRAEYVDYLWIAFDSIDRPCSRVISWLEWAALNCVVSEWSLNRVIRNWVETEPIAATDIFMAWLEFQTREVLKASILTRQSGDQTWQTETGQFYPFTSETKAFFEKDFTDVFPSNLPIHARLYLIRRLMPWLVRVLENYPAGYESTLNQFRAESDSYTWLRDEEYGLRGSPLLDFLQQCIEQIAEEHPEELRKILIPLLKVDSITIQRLVIFSAQLIATYDQEFILGLVRSDNRRLNIGCFTATRFRSVDLVRAGVAVWSDIQLIEFQHLVMTWCPFRELGNEEFAIEYRANLLELVPQPERIQETRNLIEKYYADVKLQQEKYAESNNVASMSVTQAVLGYESMEHEHNEQIIALIDAENCRVEAQPVQPVRSRYDRYSVFEQALMRFANTNTERALQILRMLNSERHSRIAKHLLRSLNWPSSSKSEIEIDVKELLVLLSKLCAEGFSGRIFEDAVGYAIFQLGAHGIVVPKPLTETLRAWLLSFTPISEETRDVDAASNSSHFEKRWNDENPRAAPILWGNKHGDFIPNEYYWIAEAIKAAEYSCANPESSISWAETMQLCIDLKFSDQIWVAWLFSSYNYAPDNTAFAPVVQAVFESNQRLRSNLSMHLALGKFSNWLDPQQRSTLISYLYESHFQSDKQAAGEIAGLLAIRNQADDLVTMRIGNVNAIDNEPFAAGVVISAAFLWYHPEYRARATDILVAHCATRCPAAIRAFEFAFQRESACIADEFTKRFLVAISESLDFSVYVEPFFLVKRLGNLIDAFPSLVLAICQKIVAVARNSDRGNRHGRLARVDETLVKIALTLHRRTETREEALTLFEDLQELEARGVDDYLNSGSDDP